MGNTNVEKLPRVMAMLGFQKEGRRPLGFAIFEYLNCLPALNSVVKVKKRLNNYLITVIY